MKSEGDRKRKAVSFMMLVLVLVSVGYSAYASNNPDPKVRTIRNDNEKSDALGADGEDLLRAGNYQEAVEKLRQALNYWPDAPERLCNYATALAGLGQYEQALTEVQKAAKLKPNLAIAYLNMANYYHALRRPQQAITALKKYLQLDPHGPYAATAQREIAMAQSEILNEQNNQKTANGKDYLADVTKRVAVRWPISIMPIKICIEQGRSVPHYRPNFESILRQAFAEWEQASKGVIKFDFTKNPQHSDIDCVWQSNPTSTECGNCDHCCEGHDIRKAYVKLYTADSTGTPLSNNKVYKVALHEIGHALGLIGHSSNPDDVMFYTQNGKNGGLSERDKNTLIGLYKMDESKLTTRPPEDK